MEMEDSVSDNDEQRTLTDSRNSPPHLPEDSPGSSVSIRLQEEYSELLKYTVNSVTLNGDGREPEEDIGIEPALVVENGLGLDKNDNKSKATASVIKDCTMTKNNTSDQERSPRSHHSIDSAVSSMGTKLDGWLGQLKDKILGELGSALLASLESQNQEQRKEMNELTSEKVQLEKEINKLNETINCLEQSISHKDTLIDNMTQSLAAQKEKTDQALKFYNWKAIHHDSKREQFTEKLAVQHHDAKIQHKVFKAWFGLIQTKWRSRVERACQGQAQSVCLQLTNDYEAKISSLNETVRSLENKVASLLAEKEAYADQVKKAFMRGVCALNIEAMSAFNPDQQESDSSFYGTSSAAVDSTHSLDITSNNVHSNLEISQPLKDRQLGKSLPSELTMTTVSSMDLLAGSHVNEPAQPMSLTAYPSTAGHKTKAKLTTISKTKSSSAGHRLKPQCQQPGVLVPPMASVVVERHQPVTKKTIGKATAVQYPKHSAPKSSKGGDPYKRSMTLASTAGQHFKPLAGQTVNPDLLKTQVMSIKVVD